MPDFVGESLPLRLLVRRYPFEREVSRPRLRAGPPPGTVCLTCRIAAARASRPVEPDRPGPLPPLKSVAPNPEGNEYQDAHQRAHADEIKERFTSRQVTTWEVVLFGLTGGLMPCNAALTVLVMCLQAKRLLLGMMIVLAFSIGLAITLVAFGTLAALSVKVASARLKNFDSIARKMPYASSGLMALIGLVIAVQGLRGILR